ncbi:MAG TPA: ankyrin repeat domain-containing protein [Vicinamibacterales bacterium]
MNRSLVVGVAFAVWFGVSAPALAADADAPLAAAVKRQDAVAVKALLRQKAQVNAPDAEGMTALHWAAHYNDLTTVRALLAAGAKATVANRFGVTPLHEAATLGNVAMVSALLRAGADADATYGDGETPLMVAARAGSVDVVKALVERGAKVNATEQFRGQTALMLAANENHAAVVKALLDAGANPNARTREYDFQNLTGGAGGIIHDRPQGGLTALILAARQGGRESAEMLLAAGADINAVEPQYQFSPLQTAVFNGQYALAKMLIEKGANVNDGSLYLTMEMRNLAAYSNRPNPPEADRGVSHMDIATLLLDKGADPNLPYVKTVPPRQAQGNINVPPGGTPLYRAVRAVDLAAVRLLLDRGARPGMAIGDGSVPVMAAAGLGAPRGGDEEVTEAGDRNDPVDVLKVLVEKGADVNAVNGAGMTAMHYAVQRGSDRIIQYLAAQGARFDVKNKQGRTAADLARGKTAALVADLGGAPVKGPVAVPGGAPAAPAAPSQR